MHPVIIKSVRSMVARVIHVLLMFLLVIFVATLASKAVRAAEPEFKWRHFGAAPYASSHDEACKKAQVAIDGFNMPLEVKEHFKSVLGTTCKGGSEVWLTPHQKLEQMWTGGVKPHVMNNVTVAEIPVTTAPDGRQYRKGSVAETVKALAWAFTHDGKTYVLYDPFVCGNFSWAFAPAPAVEQCVTLEYDVMPGDEVRFAVLAQKRLPASACWQLCDGNDCAAPPSPCDTCDWIGPKSVVPTEFEPLHTGRYIARAKHQVLRFPREVTSNYVALCDERAGLGESDADVVTPNDWQGQSVHHVPASWPLWGTTGNGSYKLPDR
jgi:hypothetical protein